ncbi:MAG: CDP-glycerol glycerophosphotransferase family protein [Clostridiales Family XIII bacterium]|nr:CDP-glycerol glycerophosphotransferase family protein [Clostridiales Family XIII bacterium]
MKRGPASGNVIFVSRQGDEPSEDYRALAETLRADGIRTEMYLQRQEKDGSRFMANAIANMRMILRQMRALSRARVAVTDGYSIPISILKHRKELTVIQMWHAIGAVKKFGLQTLQAMSDRDKRRAKLLCMHAGYDFFIAPSESAARFFAEAFGMSEDKALITGTPYVDALYVGTFNQEGDIAAAYPEFDENEKAGRPLKVVLYVPTYRKDTPGHDMDKTYERGEGPGALRKALGSDGYMVIEKKHPVDEVDGSGIYAEELLYAADIVVTDYSSLAFAAALVGKPLYYYIYDIEDYRRSPGLNIDPELEYGRYAARSARAIARLIREKDYDMEYERAFARKYVETYDGGCTERLKSVILRALGDETVRP